MNDVLVAPMKALRKGLVVSAVMAALIAMAPTASAASATRVAEMTVTSSLEGNMLHLTATTSKHGSVYGSYWAGVNRLQSFRDTGNDYVSTTDFSPPGPGSYVIEYRIIMLAGNSDTEWVGAGEVAVTMTEGNEVSVQLLP